MSADPDLLAVWTRGWTLTRGVGTPVRDGAAWRIEVGAHDQLRRFVFGAADMQVTARAEMISEPNVLLKVCADAAAVRPLLPSGWVVRPPGFMMTLEGRMREGDPPTGCRAAFETVDGVLFCWMTVDGVEVARGRAVAIDGLTIFDRIAVEPDWRRRGLGGEVMRRLQAETGPDRGVLVATADGRALYSALGWRLHSAYTTAASPGSL